MITSTGRTEATQKVTPRIMLRGQVASSVDGSGRCPAISTQFSRYKERRVEENVAYIYHHHRNNIADAERPCGAVACARGIAGDKDRIRIVPEMSG
jgi:hypothetical protein